MDEQEFEARVARRIRDRFGAMSTWAPARPPLSQLAGNGLAGDRRSMGRARPLVRSPLAPVGLAAAAVLVAGALIVATSLLPKSQPAGTLADTSTPAPSESASATPSASSVGSPTARPLGYRALVTAGSVQAVWAPDGGHVAIQRYPEITSDPPVSWLIFDRAGKQVASVNAEYFGWTGADSYSFQRTDGNGAASDFSGHLGSTAETPIKSGPILTDIFRPCVATSYEFGYTVWLGPKESGERPGYPMACSADRSLIAIINPIADQGGVSGPLQVLQVGNGHVVWALPTVVISQASPVEFSPDGRHLVADHWIVDLQTGSVVTLPVGFSQSGAWLPDGRVALVDADSGTVRAFSVIGTESPLDLPSGQNISVSPKGTVAVFGGVSVAITFITGGKPTAVAVPFGLRNLVWSPDGLEVIAEIGEWNGNTYSQQALLIEVP